MPEPLPPSSSFEAKLDRMIYLLERIERHYNPPAWKKALTFILEHFLMILILLFLAYVTWKIWGIITGLEMQVASLKSSFSEFQTSVTDQFGKLKLW